jgi:hypothetical protein
MVLEAMTRRSAAARRCARALRRRAGAVATLMAGGLLVSACATVTSTQEAVDADTHVVSASEGLPYYLPKRPILITVVVDKGDKPAPPSLTVAQGVMEPDMAHRFTLKYGQNAVGTNAIVVGINSKGLLQSANNTITSSTGQIATNLGAVLGAVSGMAVPAAPAPAQPCVAGQTYNYVYHTDGALGAQPPIACGITLTITRDIPTAKIPSAVNASLLPGAGKSKAGFFFRQEIAYKIEATDTAGALLGQWIAYSPDASDTFFYPISATLFANSHTNFTFTDGIPSNVDQTTDSEINGVLQIPANIISGYTTALGQVFSAFNTDRTDKVSAAVSKSKLEYCKATIAANSLAGKSPADQATAEANIKAACQ